ncbi:hypothetical protein B0A55_01877 [Friedmanniomyces simplex]|uniref:BZIP domain-containing protein n=1 Tax=Friedmanniomyces simplex TaxID=329884 RepID=A0A4U0XSM5_9PEZI|nr:hypothetical protein B0A55_01877 [Friedmanniomyces simplex]
MAALRTVQAFPAFSTTATFATATSTDTTFSAVNHTSEAASTTVPATDEPATTASGPPSAPKSTPRSSKRSLSPSDPENRHHKRQRNTEAARRYRQRKVDRVAELEEALAVVMREREELRLKLAKAEGEVGVLRGLVGGR